MQLTDLYEIKRMLLSLYPNVSESVWHFLAAARFQSNSDISLDLISCKAEGHFEQLY